VATTSSAEARELVTLAGDIARDAKTLLAQQYDLLRAEVRQGVRQAGGAAGAMAAGGALVAASGLFAGLAVAHLLHRATGLPLWASYGAVGGAAAAGGLSLLNAGRAGLADVDVLPRSAEALGDNLTWLHDRVTAAAATGG
jgi:hypothetical protein